MNFLTDLPSNLFQIQSEEDVTLKEEYELVEVTIRFAGDSGDGMQLTGTQFTSTTAVAGNELATFPDFPAEIRAPQGTIAGVSGFQIHFSSKSIKTAGDAPDVLVAMNPAALKANLKDLKKNGILIINEDAFTEENFTKAKYTVDPRTDDSLAQFRVISIPINKFTFKALETSTIKEKEKDRCKNMFALGVMYWLFHRDLDLTVKWLKNQFSKKPELAEANIAVLKAGYHFGETTELLPVYFHINKATLAPGTYRNITGNEALAMGMIAASTLSNVPMLLGAYPITPASDVLHFLAKHKHYGIRTLQAEDEIAAISAAIGASFAGTLGVSTTSGPGFALKSEALNLAVMLELPLVVINIQRGGPSTGLPTKSEQTDLLQVLYNRNGESPICVIAARSASDCFYKAIEAFQIAVKYMTPVVLLSDGYLANSAEPWKLPTEDELPKFDIVYHTNPEGFKPYSRNPETYARPWVKPGTPGLEHRIGGLEKEDVTGNVNYDPLNHEKMVHLRAEKINKIQNHIPKAEVLGVVNSSTLIVGWGSTYGAITDALVELAASGIQVAHLHLDYISPFPSNLEEIFSKYSRIIVAELNLGQLALLLQGKYAIRIEKINKVQGKPFKVSEIVNYIKGV